MEHVVLPDHTTSTVSKRCRTLAIHSTFSCYRCSQEYDREDGGEGAQRLSATITRSQLVANMTYLECCKEVVQCSQCPYNISSDNPALASCCRAERRTTTGYMTRSHVTYSHPGTTSNIKDECKSNGGRDSGSDRNNGSDLLANTGSVTDADVDDDQSIVPVTDNYTAFSAAQTYVDHFKLLNINFNEQTKDKGHAEIHPLPIITEVEHNGRKYLDFSILTSGLKQQELSATQPKREYARIRCTFGCCTYTMLTAFWA